MSFSSSLQQTRLWTRVVLAVCVGVCALINFGPGGWTWRLCFNPSSALSFGSSLVFHPQQLYTIFTSPFAHAGLFHLLLNMAAWVQLGNTFEISVGTVQFQYLFWLSTILIGVVMLLLDFVYHTVMGSSVISCHLGLSGILFCLMVLDLRATPLTVQRSIFGFFDVPAPFYPWVLLVVIQVLFPGTSFLGHLSGILVGYLLVHFFESILVSPNKIKFIDDTLEPFLSRYRYAPGPLVPSFLAGREFQLFRGFREMFTRRWVPPAPVPAPTSYAAEGQANTTALSTQKQPETFPGQGHVLGSA